MNELYAHSNEDCTKETWQTLSDHLNNVADIAGVFAKELNFEIWGRTLGLLHDAGKSSGAFQQRLEDASVKADHSTAGACIARERYDMFGTLLSYAISGHHGGMPNAIEHIQSATMNERLSREIPNYDAFFELVSKDQIILPQSDALVQQLLENLPLKNEVERQKWLFSCFLLTRLMYSCLVDADYLDTERFYTPGNFALRNKPPYKLEDLFDKLTNHMHNLINQSDLSTPVNQARQSIYKDCLTAADTKSGLFKLTVPTGGGKTLSSLAFALKHAILNGQKRIIYSIPFTSIVEQTAEVLKDIFGEDAVLEHHSNFDLDVFEDEGRLSYILAAQNWDAPIIVTTNVQFFESIYTNKPSKSRKLHNIGNSVVILDEAQTLPDALLEPSLAALEVLATTFNSSIVLCTATQPALDAHWPFNTQPYEIITDRTTFTQAFGNRVCFENLGDIDEADLSERIASFDQALCIVGTRNEARKLYQAVREHLEEDDLQDKHGEKLEGIYHLSASMIPAHRSEVINEIRTRLAENKRCLVVSTQLVEAGVDVDFPVVFREMAGLDSIVQAAGRCNREGRRSKGTVYVFDYCIGGERQTTSRWLEKMKLIGRNTLRTRDGIIDDETIEQFFQSRYETENLDAKRIVEKLTSDSIFNDEFKTYEFERYAKDYRLIDDEGDTVFIPRGDKGMELLAQLEQAENPASMTSKVQRYCISIPTWYKQRYLESGVVDELGPYIVVRTNDLGIEYYQEDIGLLLPEEGDATPLII